MGGRSLRSRRGRRVGRDLCGKTIRAGQFDARLVGGRLVLREDGVDADQPS
jgi:hypothetical protein